jgi:hypothetical protein
MTPGVISILRRLNSPVSCQLGSEAAFGVSLPSVGRKQTDWPAAASAAAFRLFPGQHSWQETPATAMLPHCRACGNML